MTPDLEGMAGVGGKGGYSGNHVTGLIGINVNAIEVGEVNPKNITIFINK